MTDNRAASELLSEQATVNALAEEIQAMEQVWEEHPTLTVLRSALALLEREAK